MVQILPAGPSFGSMLGQNLGQGLGAGISKAADFAMEMAMEKAKVANKQKLFQDTMARGRQKAIPEEQKRKLFLDFLPEFENMKRQQSGEDLTPEDLDGIWQNFDQILQAKGMDSEENASESPVDELMRRADAYESIGEHAAASTQLKKAEILEKRSLAERKEGFAREKEAEPKLLEMEDRLRSHETQSMRFDRLEQLFSPEFEEKFPSAPLIGLFTTEGELSPKAASLLSPEAQEAVKLVADEISGAKDSFGARVTNFDLQAYMKKLPTLLNTAEGRRRVLRDLKIINDLNRMHDEGVLDIMEKHGGPGKISLSKAERMYRKQFAPKIKEIREQFVNPEKSKFSDLPSASVYQGRKIVDEETGQEFISDGNEWIPQ